MRDANFSPYCRPRDGGSRLQTRYCHFFQFGQVQSVSKRRRFAQVASDDQSINSVIRIDQIRLNLKFTGMTNTHVIASSSGPAPDERG
ncbi:hypothetical protein ASD48_32550 [Streptomyces sp. Root1310]|nr:hypothetical protein ASD48_32550 [Streptomyces sp. Root1310]